MQGPSLTERLVHRGFKPEVDLGPLAPFVSAAFVRSNEGEVQDLVLVVDRTDPGGATADVASGSPHRSSGRLGAFSAPVEAVLLVGRTIRRTFRRPLVRVVVMELANTPATDDDRRRLALYKSPSRGPILVGALHYDVDRNVVYTNGSAAPQRIGLRRVEDLAGLLSEEFGATIERADGAAGTDFVPLFTPRAIGVATFFASPLAGASLLGMNYYRTRRPLHAAVVLATALAVTSVMFLVTSDTNAAARVVTLPFTFGAIAALTRLAKSSFGEPLRPASKGLAVLLCVGALFVVFLGSAASALVEDGLRLREVRSASGAKLVTDRKTPEAVAAKVAASLEEAGVLNGPESGVVLETDRGRNVITVRFTEPKVERLSTTRAAYARVARKVSSDAFDGAVVSFAFEDDDGKIVGTIDSTTFVELPDSEEADGDRGASEVNGRE